MKNIIKYLLPLVFIGLTIGLITYLKSTMPEPRKRPQLDTSIKVEVAKVEEKK